MIDLVKCIEKGICLAKDKSPASFYGWAVTKLYDEKREWREDKLHASDFTTLVQSPKDRYCPRQLWLRYHKAKRKEDKLGKKIMWDQGKAMQYRFTWYLGLGLPKNWEIFGIEVDVSDALPGNLTGHADLVLYNKEKLETLVVEIKTQRGASFRYMKEAKPAHVMQKKVYEEAIRRTRNTDENVESCVLYLDREGQNTPVVYTNSFDIDLKEGYEKLKKIVNGKKPPILKPDLKIRRNKGPDSVYVKQPWQCEYCSYRDMSCPSALKKAHRTSRIVAKVDKEKVVPKETCTQEFKLLITELCQEHLENVG